jgi:oligopeptide/dipeptide ABC transporter ATP-binding protein
MSPALPGATGTEFSMGGILEIRDLSVNLMTVRGIVHAVQGVSLSVEEGELHGVVGESGCGKSMTVKSIMKLHDPKRTEYLGEISFQEKNILECPQRELEKMRGKDISMIFQDPMVSLNPIMKIGEQVADIIRIKEGTDKAEARKRALAMLESVGIHPAPSRFEQYPFELSGGMLQRVMIAIALSCNPKLLIADEPTTALDVTIQAQILDLIKALHRENNMSVIVVTHNFGVVAELCDRVTVMYAGKVVETGDAVEIFDHPKHPYTAALLASRPKKGQRSMQSIPGAPPSLLCEIPGCAYADRCAYAKDIAGPKNRKNRVRQPPHGVLQPVPLTCGKLRKEGDTMEQPIIQLENVKKYFP